MDITALVEQIDAGRFRAVTTQPVALESEGPSRAEALAGLRELARKRFATSEVVQITIPDVPLPHPWLRFAGIWKDHPEFDDFLSNIADYRRQVDESEPRP